MSVYVNPFPSKATTTGRTDMGVDLGGSGPVLAIGKARILRTHSPWPEYGSTGVLYQLLEGPAKGRTVYVYEGVNVTVRPGQIVNAGQQIGTIVPNTSTGIETGWADPSTGQPIASSEFSGENETAAGKAFKLFLGSLRAGGVGGLSGFEKSLIAQGKSPAEARKIAHSESGEAGLGLPFEGTFEKQIGEPVNETAESAINTAKTAAELTKDVVGVFEDPGRFFLTIGLVLGGAFLAYFGIARMVGVAHPVAGPARGLKTIGEGAAAGAA